MRRSAPWPAGFFSRSAASWGSRSGASTTQSSPICLRAHLALLAAWSRRWPLRQARSTSPGVAGSFAALLCGLLSGAVGRNPVLVSLAACSAILPVTLFSLMARGTTSYALLGALVLPSHAGAIGAVGAITTAEQFPG